MAWATVSSPSEANDDYDHDGDEDEDDNDDIPLVLSPTMMTGLQPRRQHMQGDVETLLAPYHCLSPPGGEWHLI